VITTRFEITDRRWKTDLRLIAITVIVILGILAVMAWVGMSNEQQQAVILPLIGAITAGITNKIKEFTGTNADEPENKPIVQKPRDSSSSREPSKE